MMLRLLILCISAGLLLPISGFCGEVKGSAAAWPVKYAGGSVGLKQDTVKAVVENDQITFVQHGRRISVPVQSITEISCATDVHRRFGAAVVDVLPFVRLSGRSEY